MESDSILTISYLRVRLFLNSVQAVLPFIMGQTVSSFLIDYAVSREMQHEEACLI